MKDKRLKFIALLYTPIVTHQLLNNIIIMFNVEHLHILYLNMLIMYVCL